MSSKEDILAFIEDNFLYNKETGEFRWSSPRAGGKVKQGSLVGSTNGRYKQVRIYGKWYKLHRLVWLLETGDWPKDQIDHINRDGFDNRFINLRDVSNYKNCLNRSRKSSSGEVGVVFCKQTKKWSAQTFIGGVAKHLGRFSSIKEAKDAYNKANEERILNG